jgi:dienelactone hydrolase
MKTLAFALVLLFIVPTIAFAQTFIVFPDHILVDESATIRVSGLQPNERVSIRAELVDGAGQRWASEADFIGDPQGAIDLSKQAPVKGSYHEVSPLGLVWSMKPPEKDVASYVSPTDFAPQTIQFHLIRRYQPQVAAQLEQRALAEHIRRIKLEGKLHGVLFLPAASERIPAALVLGGSEGGLTTQKAAWLASHGYAALALAYFRYEDLPPNLEAIPLEYFGAALAWLMQRPEILPDRVAVVGTSRGGELALQLASMYPQIAATVAYVPANVRYPACCGNFNSARFAWSWQGEPLPFVPAGTLRHPDPLTEASATIAVEHAHGPILLIAGQDDGIWNSSAMTEAVVNRLKQSHFVPAVERFDYPHAGHRAGRPEIVPTWHGEVRHPVSGRIEHLGGTPQGDAESSIDGILKVLAFLQANLKTEPATGLTPAPAHAAATRPTEPTPPVPTTNQ